MKKRVAVTGANGFIGKSVCAALTRRGDEAIALVRDPSAAAGIDCAEVVEIGRLEDVAGGSADARLAGALRGFHAIVHLAGWSGSRSRTITAEVARSINVGATARLAEVAAQEGVSNFVFVSSIKAMGNVTRGTAFARSTVPAPTDLYGQTKLDAERVVAGVTGLLPTIIRPPLVYGEGMGGSLMALFKLADRGVPLPLASVRNARDFVALPSLVDLLLRCVDTPAISKRILLACDGERVSSCELYKKIGRALERRVRVFPMPPALMRAGAALLGRGEIADSVLSSLEIDDNETRSELGWQPVVTLDAGLGSVAAWYLGEARHGNGS